jgi:hypothetical protein
MKKLDWLTFGLAALLAACGSHLTAVDKDRLDTSRELAESLRKDLPDSGPVRIKGQALICDLRAIEGNVGIDSTDGGVQCPKQR